MTAPAWHAVARGAALFLGAITLLHVFGEMRFPHFNVSAWWIDLHPFPRPMGRGYLALTGTFLVLFALFPRIHSAARRLAAVCTLAFMGVALWNTVRFYQALRAGSIHTDVPLPLALHLAATAAVVIPGLLTSWDRFFFVRDCVFGWATVAVCAVGLALAQFFCLGKTDEQRSSQAVVIFVGDENTEPGPEHTAERIRAACALYHQKHAQKLLVVSQPTAGKDEGAVKQLATSQGVAADDVLTTPGGADLSTSAAAAAKRAADSKLTDVVVVAPFYQIPRIKLCCQRAGLDARSAPTREVLRPNELRPRLLREFAALWLCHLQPVLGDHGS